MFADLRIVEAADVRFYIPAASLNGYFVDRAKQRFAGSLRPVGSILQKFEPDLHAEECAGTVHMFRTGERAGAYGGFTATVIPSTSALAARLATLGVLQIVIRPTLQPQRPKYELADPERSERPYPRNPGAEAHGWRETVGGNFVDAAALHRDDRCIVSQGNPVSELIALRQMRPHIKIGLVFAAASASPSEWRSLCDQIEPVFDLLTTAPSDP